ncbi:hypothetical protein [Streptomyces sp. TS71-3]|uniref:hypothetical protein n=1 Tax=Streptomyces sp. TS71-3 TaxID=2733862 RepID=UPI001B2EEBE2|nr:hypothetical protein [Streptomyces sp. TS71-3]GHJ37181.1 hypothetical protein Sm713_27900 [Streptomyces sp. TS71-3]
MSDDTDITTAARDGGTRVAAPEGTAGAPGTAGATGATGATADDLTALLGRRFPWPEGSGVLLAGSTAEGVAMRGSNVNVLVLDAPDDWTPDHEGDGSVLRPMSLARNHLFPGDPAVNMDVVRAGPLRDLADLASGMSRIQDPGTPDLELPVLDALEIRFLARLRGGQVLHGTGAVERWRRQAHVRWLPAFHCATTYLTADHFRRKAGTAHADGLPLDAAVLFRLAVEHLLVSALAAEGRVLHEVKNLGRNIGAVLATAARPARLFTEAGSLLDHGTEPGPALFARFDACAADLLRGVGAAPHGRTAADYLAGQGHAAAEHGRVLVEQGHVQTEEGHVREAGT